MPEARSRASSAAPPSSPLPRACVFWRRCHRLRTCRRQAAMARGVGGRRGLRRERRGARLAMSAGRDAESRGGGVEGVGWHGGGTGAGEGQVHRICSSPRKLACNARPLRPELAHGRQDDQVLRACPADLAPLGGSFGLPRAFGVGVDGAVLFGGRVAGAVVFAGGRVRRGVVRLVLPPHALALGGSVGERRRLT